MSLEIQKEKIRLNKVTHAVRASQSVLQYGVGAMVDFPDQTLMLQELSALRLPCGRSSI